MKRKVALLTAAMVVAFFAIHIEQRAIAEPCKDCNTSAVCTYDCKRTHQTNPDRYYCHKVVTVGDAGNVCGDGAEGDDCENNATVVCGTQKSKLCSATTVDCTNNVDLQEATMPGCVS